MKIRPIEAAKEVGVTVNTVRNWCRDYGEFLSAGANQENGGNRELEARDVEILKYIAELRKENLLQPQIRLRLSEKSTHFGEIVTTEGAIAPANSPTNYPPNLQEPLQAEQAIIAHQALDTALQPVYARLEAIERNRLSVITAFAAGVIVAGLFFLIIVLLIRP